MKYKKKVLVWMPKGIDKEGVPVKVCPTIPLPPEGKPDRVWTVYGFCNPLIKPPVTMTPIHLDGSFLEDYLHDWNVRNNNFIYRSRVSDGGSWLLFEYKKS